MEPNQFDSTNNNTVPPIPPAPSAPSAPSAPDQPPHEPRRRPRSVVGPVILILLGLAFLANNLNIFQFNVWDAMWRLWPVWLIAAGLDMVLGRRTSWGSWVVLGVVIAVVGGATWFYSSGWGYYGTALESQTVSADLKGASRATVELKPGVGELRLTATASDDKLVEGVVNRLEGERIAQDYNGTGGDVTFSLRSEGMQVLVPGIHVNSQDGTWNLKLNRNVSLDLRLGLGVGRSEIDLSGATVNSLEVNSGVGETSVTLPSKGKMTVVMKSGIGKSTIRIPRGLAARIRTHTGIGSINVNGGDFSRMNGEYVSPNYDSAADRADIEINGGIGEVDVLGGY